MTTEADEGQVKHRLIPPLAARSPSLVIFDKDGTLIDFHTMWGTWAKELARRLETSTGLPIALRLLQVMQFDPVSGKVALDGPLAIATMAELYDLTLGVLQQAGVQAPVATTLMADVWQVPDPVLLARPLADLHALFLALRAGGLKISIATTDDRPATQATLAGLNLMPLVDALVCGDDGFPSKPAPDMVWAVCRCVGVPPERAVVVGDTRADLQMGRAAGAGCVVGVLSGVGSAADLAPHADLLLACVSDLLEKGG